MVAPAFLRHQSVRFVVAQGFKNLDELPETALDRPEIRVPTAGTWLGLGAGILVVMASFVWTIL